MKISLLARELFKEITLVFAICLGAFLSLILIGRLLQLRELFLGQGVTLVELGKMFVYLTPLFLLLLVPAACMLGLFLTFLRMGADRELISLRAGGISIRQILPAPVLFCLLATTATLGVSLVGIPWGMDHFRQTLVELARSKTSINIQPGVFNTNFPNLTFFARQAEPVRGELQDVFVHDSSRPQAAVTITAPQGHIASDAEAGQVYIVLEDGHIYREDKEELSTIKFGEYIFTLDLSQLLGGVKIENKTPKEMTWDELTYLANQPQPEQVSLFYQRVLIERHKRFALPLACLVLGLFALPLALLFQGLNRQYGLVMAMGAFFIYYVLLTAGMSLTESGNLPPALALWTPNLIFFLAALAGLWAVATEQELSLAALPWVRSLLITRKAAS